MRLLAALAIIGMLVSTSQPILCTQADEGVRGITTVADCDIAEGYDSAARPDPPRNLTLVPGVDFIDVFWESPAIDGGSPIIGYEIHRGPREDYESGFSITWTSIAYVSSSVRFYRDVDVVHGETWYYSVSASNAFNSSYLLDDAWALVGGSTPGAPVDLIAEAGGSQVNLTWSIPSDQGGTEVFTYNIYRGTSDGAEDYVTTVRYPMIDHTWPNLEVWFTDKNLTNGQRYFYRISAINTLGEGLKSNSASTIPDFAPAAVFAYGFSVVGDEVNVTLLWKHPSEQYDKVTCYVVYRQTTPGDPILKVATIDRASTSFNETLDRHSIASYRVAAIYEDGHEVFSDSAPVMGHYWEGGGSQIDLTLVAMMTVATVFILGLLLIIVYKRKR